MLYTILGLASVCPLKLGRIVTSAVEGSDEVARVLSELLVLSKE